MTIPLIIYMGRLVFVFNNLKVVRGMSRAFHLLEVKMRFEFHNETFLPAISAIALQDAAIAAAWKKIEYKVVRAYADTQGIEATHLRLIDLCKPDGRLHPRLRAFVEKLPRGEKQSAERFVRYKQEICAHLQRVIDATIEQLRNPSTDPTSTTDADDAITQLEHDEHPVLAEIYKTLPRETVFIPCKGRTRTDTVTENGRLFYLSCVDVLKTSDATTAQEFLLNTRLITKAIEQICPVEKIASLMTIFDRTRKQLGVVLPKSNPQLRSHDWPSPLREEFQQLLAVVKSPVSGEVRRAAAATGVKVHHKVSSVTVNSVETNVGRLLVRYWSGGTLSVRDIMKTSKTLEVGSDGNEHFVYYNSFLTPFRERERARESKSKSVGFDSCTFKSTVSCLKTLAAYNGIFEYHRVFSEAFKPHIDLDRQKERKAEKKALIDRHELDAWIEHNWSKYEHILKGKTFVRDKSKRSLLEADKNMRFVLFYLELATMKVMGYRQRQVRDCLYGVNLRITNDGFTFSYTKEQTKNGKPLNFTANMRTSGITHGRLYQTLSLFHRHAFPYVQNHLAPRLTDDEVDPSGQFFVYLDSQGYFRCFQPFKTQAFSGWFRNACRRFLSGPELSKQAILLLHSHYLRGASIDTFILDQGGSSEAASKYYGNTVTVIDQSYRDRHAVQDASRDVILVNASLKQLDELEASDRNGGSKETRDTEPSPTAGISALLETNKLLLKQLTAANERIGKLESMLSQFQESMRAQAGA